jgi:hypothetical protein
MEVPEEDLDDRKVIRRIRNGTKGTFLFLSEVRQEQSEFRAQNMARKRSKKPASGSLSLEDSNPPQASHGIPPSVCPAMLRSNPLIDPLSGPSSSDTRQPAIPTSSSSMRLPKVAETRNALVTASSTTTASSGAGVTTTTTTVVQSNRRIVSDASIAAPEQDSAGGTRVFANNEKSSDIFANNLMYYVVTTVWPDGVVLDWVEGRDGETTLEWNSGYLSPFPVPPCPRSAIYLFLLPFSPVPPF